MNAPQPINDIATIEQQLEQHALNVERVQREAIFEIGRELAAAQELFRYRRDEGGFTGWLASRLPQIPQSSAYQAIEIATKIDGGMFLNFGNIKPGALAEVAKAEPDIQKLIAERVEAGEIFTAAKVKEIRQQAARDAAQSSAEALETARAEISKLTAEVAAAGKATARQQRQISELQETIAAHERDIKDYENSLPNAKEAEKQAAALGEGAAVLGKDLKFHTGATEAQKALSADYLAVWGILKEFKRELPLTGRVVAGCKPDMRNQLLTFCNAALSYIERLKGDLEHGEVTDGDSSKRADN